MIHDCTFVYLDDFIYIINISSIILVNRTQFPVFLFNDINRCG